MLDQLQRGSMQALRDEIIELVDRVSPSVVTVRNTDVRLTASSGSGWAIASDLIVTNAHVAEGQSPRFKIRLKGGALVPATLVGSDPATDLAVLRAEVNLPPLGVRSTPARLGELCCAFGSPLGEFPETVTFGVVSGLDRRLEHSDGWSIEGVLQTDAEINHGNSGGPLVDFDGSVLGVNSAIRADGRGVGFSIPAPTVASIVPELIEFGSVVRPRLGVTIDVVEHRSEGVERERLRIANVSGPGPFVPGDVLVSIAQREVISRADLFHVLRRPLLDVATAVCVERQGELVDLQVECQAP